MGHCMLFLKQETLNQQKRNAGERAQVWRDGDAQETEQQSLEPEDMGMTRGFVTSLCNLGQVTLFLSSLSSSVK